MLKNKVRSIVAGCCAAALCLMSTTGAYAATSRSVSYTHLIYSKIYK